MLHRQIRAVEPFGDGQRLAGHESAGMEGKTVAVHRHEPRVDHRFDLGLGFKGHAVLGSSDHIGCGDGSVRGGVAQILGVVSNAGIASG